MSKNWQLVDTNDREILLENPKELSVMTIAWDESPTLYICHVIGREVQSSWHYCWHKTEEDFVGSIVDWMYDEADDNVPSAEELKDTFDLNE